MTYDFKRLENISFFTTNELETLESINKNLSLKEFLKNKNLVEKFGFDFVYTSAKIEGNTYSKADALTLIDYGKTAGGKNYSDAKMLINLNRAFKYILNDDCIITKHKVRTLHQILSDELVEDEDMGCVRKKGVLTKGSDYVSLSDSISLESELDRLLSISKNIENPYDKALYIHNNLAYLQYFVDVNKRTARTMLNLSLICDDKMLLIPSEELISVYIEGVLDYYKDGNVEKSKEFFIQSYKKMNNFTKALNY
jgi:Fic family protein